MTRSVLTALLFTVAVAAQTQTAQAPRPSNAGPRVTELSPNTRTFQIVFSRGDEVAAALADFAEKNDIKVGYFTAVGAFGDAILGWYDPQKRTYKQNPFKEEMEIVSFSGNITRGRDNKPNIHAHCVVAMNDGSTRGGHFIEGHISLTMQMYLTATEPLAATQSASR